MSRARNGEAALATWNTREPLPEGFARDWRERMGRCEHAHFGLDLDYLSWSARAGESGHAVLVQDGERRGAFAVREERGGLVSGWPWRWQFVVEGDDDHGPQGASEDAAVWMSAQAMRWAGGRRLQFHRPRVAQGGPGFVAGTTYVHSLAPAENLLLEAFEAAKRRNIKRAVKLGYEVVETRDPEHLRAFARFQHDTQARHGVQEAADRDAGAQAGDGWREWELPWMRLFVAILDGEVQAGSGFGAWPGASLEYRTNASGERGRKDGANVLLAWEAIRRARAEGYRWINWGGSNRFKRELGGTRIEVACVLGGGAAWAIPNAWTTTRRRARAALGRRWRAWQSARAATKGGGEA